jgi:hypothetical protein
VTSFAASMPPSWQLGKGGVRGAMIVLVLLQRPFSQTEPVVLKLTCRGPGWLVTRACVRRGCALILLDLIGPPSSLTSNSTLTESTVPHDSSQQLWRQRSSRETKDGARFSIEADTRQPGHLTGFDRVSVPYDSYAHQPVSFNQLQGPALNQKSLQVSAWESPLASCFYIG